MSAAAADGGQRAARVERLRRAVRSGRLVIAADPFVILRSRRRGRVAIDARLVAGALIAAEPEFFGPEGV